MFSLYNMIYFITVLLFGTTVSFCFAGVAAGRKERLYSLLFCIFEGLLQIVISHFFGFECVRQLYPVLTHLPLILFLVLVQKCTLLNASVSVFSAYLCCQIPWWIGHLCALFLPGKTAVTAIYMLSALIVFWCIYKYIAQPAEYFIKYSKTSALLIGAVPFFYYLFDYLTTVYTHTLYSGNTTACLLYTSL